ncbi:MAG: Hsp20/alpha crystallin family protein [Verrucomicrobiales bacterium]|nr:Hsp20/alpha crystallin family protein [Verrucomicrobiales bacterium]
MLVTRYGSQWNPWKEMEELQNRLGSVFGSATTRQPAAGTTDEKLTVSAWTPLVDIAEDDKEYTIKAEVPEINKTDLSVKVQDGVLTISGERKFEKEENGKRYHRVERVYGNFTRSFSLPENADESKVNAEFKDGVLVVKVGKSERAKPKQVEVKIN